ncbi:unnamed protein product [Caenorhabditis angaria]|uniref:Uncharacterized protein n=1 Tax=Caenorhabditis angaria TaxID=860376 RepID=A0A9P1MT99_9PELO|nr:unnamed protein product [Caenorhabditis angaria]
MRSKEWFGEYKYSNDCLFLKDDKVWNKIKFEGAKIRNVVFTHLWFLAIDQINVAFVGRIDLLGTITKLNIITLESEPANFEVGLISENEDDNEIPSTSNDSGIPTDWTVFTTSKEAFLLTPQFKIFKILSDPNGLQISKNPISFPWPTKIQEISTGNDFVVFRDHVGNLFSMGTGTRGELGVGLIRRVDEPVHIEELSGIPIKKVVCGGWHCIALSEGNDVYGWGWNKYEQLGKDKMSTEMYPTVLFDLNEHDADNSLIIDYIVADMHSSTISFNNKTTIVSFGKHSN